MFYSIIPKLPMRDKKATRDFYSTQLGFTDIGKIDYNEYLIMKRDNVEIHFYEYKKLDPLNNYGQVYIRLNDIEKIYQKLVEVSAPIHPNGKLMEKSWGQKEFSMLDPDNNLLTFGESI